MNVQCAQIAKYILCQTGMPNGVPVSEKSMILAERHVHLMRAMGSHHSIRGLGWGLYF